jgi:hypothetical protein
MRIFIIEATEDELRANKKVGNTIIDAINNFVDRFMYGADEDDDEYDDEDYED